MKTFEDVFGARPEVTAAAPGRVNLLGEHTDYNDGFVLPTAIPQRTTVSIRRNGLERTRLHATEFGSTVEFSAGEPPGETFAKYVYGCIHELADTGTPAPPLDIHVHSEVPMGVGLSSSAALEVATLRALRQLLGVAIDDARIAQLAQQAEIRYAGVRCGIMDQMASSLSDGTTMLFLDTRTLGRRLLPLPAGELLVIDSGISRSLASSGYNERRAECEEAARRLGVRALRDVTDAHAVERLPEPYRRRARHVVTENGRVLEAAAGVDAMRFGALMDASHASLRDDYEVSVPGLDALVAALQQQADVYGARLTGAGFGGACVALCKSGAAREAAATALSKYAAQGGTGRRLVPADEDSR